MCFKEVDVIITQIKAKHCDKCKHFRCTLCDIDEVLTLLEEADDADVEEVKHGYWEVCSDEYEICASEFVCSNCKESFVSSDLTDEQFFETMKYCPNCGAKMDERKGE